MANEKRLIDAYALLEKIQFRRPVIDTETKIVSDCVQIARETIVNAPHSGCRGSGTRKVGKRMCAS